MTPDRKHPISGVLISLGIVTFRLTDVQYLMGIKVTLLALLTLGSLARTGQHVPSRAINRSNFRDGAFPTPNVIFPGI